LNHSAIFEGFTKIQYFQSYFIGNPDEKLDIIKNYDRVAVMKAGKIGEIGPYDELMEKKGLLYELVHGKN